MPTLSYSWVVVAWRLSGTEQPVMWRAGRRWAVDGAGHASVAAAPAAGLEGFLGSGPGLVEVVFGTQVVRAVCRGHGGGLIVAGLGETVGGELPDCLRQPVTQGRCRATYSGQRHRDIVRGRWERGIGDES
jgi:hypothetical protein